MTDSEIRHSPAAERNRDPILAQLQRLLPPQGVMLEIAAGSGQHAAHFAAALPQWDWIASEGDAASLASIAAWCRGVANVRAPLQLDLLSDSEGSDGMNKTGWPTVATGLQAIYVANLLHIAPWDVTPALVRGAAHHLAAGGHLLIYGPFIVDGEPLAASNRAFDIDLRQRDSRWGLRRLSAVTEAAASIGLLLREAVPMPANNLLLVFEQPASAGLASG
ncbi:MAG: DUF938 domain-containing protein [Rubrivivax sp.]